MVKQCRHCGNNFEVDESNQHERRKEYCSALCGSREREKRKKIGPVRIEKTCQECGATYTAKRFDSVTCGPKCYEERNRRRVREYGAVYREAMRAERLLKQKKPKPKKIDTLAEFDRKARKMGMTYGQYELYLRLQKGV